MRAAGQTLGQHTARLGAAGRPPALPHGVAVTGMDLDGRTTRSDAEFDDPLRRRRPGTTILFLLARQLLRRRDLRIYPARPVGVPDQ
ncbi:hypothetical protein AQJ23_16325 [Streptomyces antibioticus]|nr:hypothetical protein AQJ23_16325 [Streptomyces antibioticus]